MADKKKKKKLEGKSSKAHGLVRQRQNKDAEAYDHRKHGGGAGGSIIDRCINPEWAQQLQIVYPKWSGNYPLVFKPIPAIDDSDSSNPTWTGTRRSIEKDDFHDWFRRLVGVSWAGTTDKKLTCLLYDKRKLRNGAYDPNTQNPYIVFQKAMSRVCQKTDRKGKVKPRPECIIRGKDLFDPDWYRLENTIKSYNSGFAMFQGVVYQNGDSIFLADGKPLGLRNKDKPVIVRCSGSAVEQLMTDLYKSKSERLNPDKDPDEQFEHGNIVDPASGKLLCIYNPAPETPIQRTNLDYALGIAKNVKTKSEDDESADVEYDEPAENAKRGSFQSYKIAILDKLPYLDKSNSKKVRNADISKYEEELMQKFLWWDDVLYYPSTEELAFWVAQAFADVPNMFKWAWRDNPEFWTADVKGVFSARTSGPGADIPDDDEDEEEETSKKKKKKKKKRDDDDDDADSDADSDESSLLDDEEEDEDSDEDGIDSDDEEDDDNDNDSDSDADSDEEDDDDSDDEDDEETEDDDDLEGFEDDDEDDEKPSKKSSKNKSGSAKTSTKRKSDDDEDEVEEEEEDDIMAKKAAKKSTKKSAKKSSKKSK